MNIPRFFCPLISPPRVALDEAESRHATQSLRLQAGDPIEVFDGRGTRASGALEIPAGIDGTGRKSKKAGARRAKIRIEQVHTTPPPGRPLTLIVAGCKGPRLEWLVEKCTELGVTSFVFAHFDRSVVIPSAGHVQKLRRTAIEACKQCGADWLPEFSTDIRVEAAAAAARAAGALLVLADPAADAQPLARAIDAASGGHPSDLAAIVGPEGGLTPTETRALIDAGAIRVRLGVNILRVETAAISIAAGWAASA